MHRLVMNDRQFVSPLPPAVDLAWFVNYCGPSAVPREPSWSFTSNNLRLGLGDRLDPTAWESQLGLALLRQSCRASSLDRVGNWHMNVGHLRQALGYQQQALDLLESLGDRRGVG